MGNSKKLQANEMSVLEAVDNLVMMADLDPSQVKKDPKTLLKELLTKAGWLTYQSRTATDEKIKTTLRVIHYYLTELSKSEFSREKKGVYQRGVMALKGLSEDAVAKVDLLKQGLFSGEKVLKVSEYDEWRALDRFFNDFYLHDLDREIVEESLDLGGAGYSEDPQLLIRDFHHLVQDQDYELLFIRREDGQPFFSQAVLDHAQAVCRFDQLYLMQEAQSPLEIISIITDDEACLVAEEIYRNAHGKASSFIKHFKFQNQDTLGQLLFSAIVALSAAKNPQNLIRSKRQKSCQGYFRDFYLFLHAIASHPLVHHQGTNAYEKERLELIERLTTGFFLHPMHHDTAYDKINELLGKRDIKPIKTRSIWALFLGAFQAIDTELKKFPAGPIIKMIEQIEKGDFERGFNPIGQGATPCRILDFMMRDKVRSLLFLPCPTVQNQSQEAYVLEEFQLLLDLHQEERFVLFNVQENEYISKARVAALESAALKHPNLFMITLLKNGSFYHQLEEYAGMDDSQAFMKALATQVKEGPASGFRFPKTLVKKTMAAFVDQVLPWIHANFFDNHPTLSRIERLNFIEIFYALFILKIIEELDGQKIAFVCKDGVDIGALMNLQFYSTLKLLIQPEHPFSEEDQRQLMQIAIVPALLQRKRLPSFQRVERMLSSLAVFEKGYQLPAKKLSELKALYSSKSFDRLKWIAEA
jgi:hypothetical protein